MSYAESTDFVVNTPEEAESFNRTLAECDKAIELGKALTFLKGLPQFNLIVDNYLKEKPLELTYMLSGVEEASTNEHNVKHQLRSIALFKQFLELIEQDAESAEHDKQIYLDRR